MNFSVFLTTIGRPELSRQLYSLVPQLSESDRLYIAIDGKEHFEKFNKIYQSFEHKFRCKVIIFYEQENLGYWGHPLRTKYQKQLEGDFILHADDDNFYTPDAFEIIRKHVTDKNKLYIFQVCFFNSTEPLPLKIENRCMDTCSGVIPNLPETFPNWENLYGGDFVFYKKLSGNHEVVFVPELISILCPSFIVTPEPEDKYYMQKTIELSPDGSFLGLESQSEHYTDYDLLIGLIEFFQNRSAKDIIDLGCGTGEYVKLMRYGGFSVDGVDGNPDTHILSNGIATYLNLAKKEIELKSYDWVMSLEVGEHIPKCFEQRFLNHVTSKAKSGVVLSWAIPGQIGYGHVNCRPNQYILEKMKQRGFQYDEVSSQELRQRASFWWFKNTLMVFCKSE